MTALCLFTLAGVLAASLPVERATLAWTHSVERIEWQEDWQVEGRQLVLAEARVKGSGAGMEVPARAEHDGLWWRFRPDLPPQESLLLARSDAVADYRLCWADACRALTSLTPAVPAAESLRLAPCD